jgi:truncated hemoglobin YjbI
LRGGVIGLDIDTDARGVVLDKPGREQGLNDLHFDRFVRHFRDALNEVGVEPDKIERVAKLLESHRSAVLNP